MKKFNHIYVEITNVCNLSCPFCIQNKREAKFLNKLEFEHIIKNIKPFTNCIYLHVLGEPLLHPSFTDFVMIADQYGMKVKLTTNGVLLDNYVDFISHSENIIRLNISLQSLINFDAAEQDKYLVNIIDLINKSKDNPNLYISLRLWNNKKELTQKEKDLINKIMDIINHNYSDTFDGVKVKDHVYLSVEDEFIWPSLDNLANEEKSVCLGGKTHLGILSNGNVVLCCLDSLGDTKIGNIFENSFEDIINNEVFKTIRDNLANKKYYFELCKKCTYRNRFLKKGDLMDEAES